MKLKIYTLQNKANGITEFLYIAQELQAAYAQDMASLAGIQSDGSVDMHVY